MPNTSEDIAVNTKPSPRRFLSRLASPFSSKSRTVSEFYVQADDPHKQYTAGTTVGGSVVVKIAKPVRVTHIVVCLHGFVQVYKNPGAPPTEGFRAHNNLIGKGRGSKTGAEYFGNGFATLFEDEAVICGDGRLDEGNYKFEFQMSFPTRPLPSSIEFERGTISYMITAIMTRPASIAPVTNHDQKIQYVENLEVSRLMPPKPRTITLEPVVRRARGKGYSKKKAVSRESAILEGEPGTPSTARQSSQFSMPGTPIDDTHRSPSPSNRSLDSEQSSNCQTSVSGSYFQTSRASDSGSGYFALPKDRTITATVESLKGGCLAGDHIPVKVVVNHTKHIKSMQGVILTLYRHARVDTHPAIPIGPMSDKDRKRHDDYYPKSLTGLGGLSLSGAGSSHVFRKDLTQLIMPLIVDHKTLMAELTAKLRVPEDAFPTIAGVPGAMISFKYYVEVILDIQGKLAGQDRYFTQSANNASSNGQTQADLDGAFNGDRTGQHRYDQSIVDTAPIRRDKSVVTCVLEVIIGTRDSERVKGKGKVMTEEQYRRRTESPSSTRDTARPIETSRDTATIRNQHDALGDEHSFEHSRNPLRYSEHDFAPVFALPVPPEGQEQLSEKEQLRRAEANLLPSQPPGMDEDFAYRAQATAPIIEDPYGYTAPPESSWDTYGSVGGAEWNTPLYEAVDGDPQHESSRVAGDEDKQEMHRRQLEMQASEPPTEDYSGQGIEGEASHSAHYASYPGEDDLYTDHQDVDGDRTSTDHKQARTGAADHLPRYSA